MTGSGPPGALALLTTWTWSPVVDALIVLGVIAYLCGTRKFRRIRRTRWPVRRTVCWILGAVVAIAAVNSALAVYSRNLLWVHMIVHLLFITVIPALAVWAQPIRLMRDAGGTRTRHVMARLGASRAARWLMAPWFTVPLYAMVLVGTHLTGFQHLVPQHMWLHDVELGLYLFSGYLLLLPIIGGELTAITLAPLLRFVVLILCMGPDTLVGVVLMLTRVVSTPAGDSVSDTVADQSLAGAIMWWGGDGLMMILLLVVAAQWIHTGTDRGLGSWLDRARQQTLLGADGSVDVDDDEAALTAYNARLAALHGLTPPEPGERRGSG